MIHELGDKKFDNQFRPDAVPAPNDYLFIFDKDADGRDAVLVRVNDGLSEPGEPGDGKSAKAIVEVPRIRDVLPDYSAYISKEYSEENGDLIYLFSIGNREEQSTEVVYECPDSGKSGDDSEIRFFMAGSSIVGKYDRERVALDGWTLESPRIFRMNEPQDMCMAGSTANHLHTWYEANRCCGKCGAEMVHGDKLRMVRCPECGNMVFPRLNPAVTVALRNGDSLMLTKYANRPGAKMMALIAGFVEIGETLEECVQREVMEEVGLKAVNIKYFGSQPWGFAGNIQIGFVADVEGDTEIVLDENELALARFVPRDELPEPDNELSLTQAMINAFRRGEI